MFLCNSRSIIIHTIFQKMRLVRLYTTQLYGNCHTATWVPPRPRHFQRGLPSCPLDRPPPAPPCASSRPCAPGSRKTLPPRPMSPPSSASPSSTSSPRPSPSSPPAPSASASAPSPMLLRSRSPCPAPRSPATAAMPGRMIMPPSAPSSPARSPSTTTAPFPPSPPRALPFSAPTRPPPRPPFATQTAIQVWLRHPFHLPLPLLRHPKFQVQYSFCRHR